MNDQTKQAMQMALSGRITEYLINGGLVNPEHMDHRAVRDLLIDCREALAQPQGDPFCGMCGNQPCNCPAMPMPTNRATPPVVPQGDPAVWITPDGEGWRMRLEPPVNDVPLGWTPLYAAPVSAKREWVELTCQEVTALIMEGAAGGGWQGFAERVQAAYKEKNCV